MKDQNPNGKNQTIETDPQMIKTLRLTIFKKLLLMFFKRVMARWRIGSTEKKSYKNLELNSPIIEIKTLIGRFISKFDMIK